jgi:hypothetical protein
MIGGIGMPTKGNDCEQRRRGLALAPGKGRTLHQSEQQEIWHDQEPSDLAGRVAPEQNTNGLTAAIVELKRQLEGRKQRKKTTERRKREGSKRKKAEQADHGQKRVRHSEGYVRADEKEEQAKSNSGDPEPDAPMEANLIAILTNALDAYTRSQKLKTKKGPWCASGQPSNGSSQSEADKGFCHRFAKDIDCKFAIRVRGGCKFAHTCPVCTTPSGEAWVVHTTDECPRKAERVQWCTDHTKSVLT